MCTERYDLSTGQRSESTRSRLRMAAGRDRCLFLSIWDHLPRKFERKLRIRQRHTQGKERTAGFLAAAPGFRPTLPPPAPPLSQIFSLSLSRIFISSSSFPKDLFSSSLFFPRSVSLLSWPLHFICRSPLRSSFVILSSSNGAPICAAGRR